jgi:capsular exopolysaccharide synthesis family protein
MSRIDEALRRAEHRIPDDDQAVAGFASDSAVPFPPEEPSRPATTEHLMEAVPEVGEAAPLPQVRNVRDLPSREKLAIGRAADASIEEYRKVAARLLMAQAERGTRVVMVASAVMGEGKTLTATNLALTLSESYKREVLLVDGDLRRPFIHQLLDVPNVSGLNDGLRNAGRKLPLMRVTDRLTVLTAGRPESDPMSVLSGDRMATVLEEAKQRFEYVIIDSPPVAMLSDAHLLVTLVDAVVLVVQAGKTQLRPIRTAVESLGRDKILGVVLNRTNDKLIQAGYDYKYGVAAARS